MEEILKIILDYGLTGAALLVLAYVVLQQMKILESFQKAIAENTQATKDLANVVKDLKTKEVDLLSAVEHCRVVQKNNS